MCAEIFDKTWVEILRSGFISVLHRSLIIPRPRTPLGTGFLLMFC